MQHKIHKWESMSPDVWETFKVIVLKILSYSLNNFKL